MEDKTLVDFEKFGDEFGFELFHRWSAVDRLALRRMYPSWVGTLKRMTPPEKKLFILDAENTISLCCSDPHCPSRLEIRYRGNKLKRFKQTLKVLESMAADGSLKSVDTLKLSWSSKAGNRYTKKLMAAVALVTPGLVSLTIRTNGFLTRSFFRLITIHWPTLEHVGLDVSQEYGGGFSLSGLQVLLAGLAQLRSFRSLPGFKVNGPVNFTADDTLTVASPYLESFSHGHTRAQFGGDKVETVIRNTVFQVLATDVLTCLKLGDEHFTPSQVGTILSRCSSLQTLDLPVHSLSDMDQLLEAILTASSSCLASLRLCLFDPFGCTIHNHDVAVGAIRTLPLQLTLAVGQRWSETLTSFTLCIHSSVCEINAELVTAIATQLPQLELLDLSNTENPLDLRDADLVPLTALSELKLLFIRNALQLTDAAFSRLLTDCPLEFLNIRKCSRKIGLNLVRSMQDKAEKNPDKTRFSLYFDGSVGFTEQQARQLVTVKNFAINGWQLLDEENSDDDEETEDEESEAEAEANGGDAAAAAAAAAESTTWSWIQNMFGMLSFWR